MKRILICIPALLVLFQFAFAADGERLRERVYISTDRDVYVAGDRVWMSAYCIDAATGRLSDFSRIAYVEVHSPDGTVETAKVALDGGRGAASLILPNSIATGNYRLLAYTSLGVSETGYNPDSDGRTISVFNTFSTARTEGGVTVEPGAPEAPARSECGALSLSVSGNRSVRITNNGTSSALFNLSVRHSDGIPSPDVRGIAGFCEGLHGVAAPLGFSLFTSEYEGEIIRARVTGTDDAGLKALEGKYAFISSPGNGSNVYSSTIDAGGNVTFYTTNIYGNQDMFLEIEGVDRDNICHLDIQRPFPDFPVGDIDPLVLCSGYADALQLRSLGMQLGHNFDADTLYTPLPTLPGLEFNDQECKVYNLDDYTRFPVMEELFTEFIQEIRVRRSGSGKELQVRTIDALNNSYFPQGTALVLLDGVPVLDHEKILAYDPLLVRRIEVYPGAYFLGIRNFRGVVNFVTYKGTLPSMKFEDNVRIVSFQGCSIPMAYTCEGVGKDWPDYRQTIWWHPLLRLAPGESMEIKYKAPDYSGAFEVFAEGLTEAGEPLSQTCLISSM
ncbi:MAG: hypothetical protein J6W82_01590 [Bacteroidales bacterium]|nr:hypothetical protein [Bacteroidales bacterium]